MKRVAGLALVLCCAAASVASADGFDAAGDYEPEVPVSAFARPSPWLDMSRLRMSAEFIMGGGSAGTSGLQVTRFQYQVASPLNVRVSIGNTFGGTGRAGAATNGMFLEGLDVSYQPFKSMLIQVRYHDVRTPLQYGSSNSFFDPWR